MSETSIPRAATSVAIDGTAGQGLPSTPTATFDPPRDARGQVRMEYNTRPVELDSDTNTEIIMTHRGGNGLFLTIIELVTAEVASGVTVNVEFFEEFFLPVTAADSVYYRMQNTGFGLTDIDGDGSKEIIMFDDNTGLVRVYEGYAFVAEWQPNPTGWVTGATVKSQIPALDFDKNGVLELYLNDSKGQTWIITPTGNVSTMFADANWHLLHDWKVGNVYNEGGEMRGCLAGDMDRDNKPDIYFAGNNFGSIMDMEYDGGDVTDGDNYSYYVTAIDANDAVDGGHFARAANIALGDMDNDGHREVVAIVPWTGGNPVANLKGLYVFEFESTTLGVEGVGESFEVPMTYSLRQNYPNPFNPVTHISYDIIEATNVTIQIYDLLGHNVKTLVNERKDVGFYTTIWNGLDHNGSKVASGVYIYRLETERFTATKKNVTAQVTG